MDYLREATFGYAPQCVAINGWYGWASDFLPTCNGNSVSYPQPIFSDIEFDDNNNIIIGLTDRSGYQIGNENYGIDVNSTDTYTLFAGGDILHACNNGDGTWVIENPANCTNSNGEAIGGSNNTYPDFIPWPSIGEFYVGDFFHDGGDITAPGWIPGHPEIVTGGLVVLPKSGEVTAIVYDPVTGQGGLFGRGGTIKLSNTTGRRLSLIHI